MTLVVGLGLRAGTPYEELLGLVQSALAGLELAPVVQVLTVEGREQEPGLLRLVTSLGASLCTMAVDELSHQQVPTPSGSVERLSGTPSVAEAAVLASGALLVVPKQRSAGATVAVGRLGPPPTG